MKISISRRNRTTTSLATIFVFVCFLGAGPLEAVQMPKTEICHFDAEEGIFKKISVSGNAIQNHLDNHGDLLPEGTSGDGSISLDAECNEIIAPAVLARAYIDKSRDGMYDPLVDVETAELLDTNPDGVPGAGDTILLGQYPTSLDLCPLPSGDCTNIGNYNPAAPLVVSSVISNTGEIQYPCPKDMELH